MRTRPGLGEVGEDGSMRKRKLRLAEASAESPCWTTATSSDEKLICADEAGEPREGDMRMLSWIGWHEGIDNQREVSKSGSTAL